MPTAEREKLSPSERAEAHARKIADLVVAQLKQGTAPWQQPWDLAQGSGLPVNGSTHKTYRGSNLLYLWALSIDRGYTDNRWLTYRQAESLSAQVRKNEHGVQICFPAKAYEVIKKDEHGKPVIGNDGQPETLFVKYDSPKMRYYTVFHASQIDNLPPLPERKVMHEWERHERAEAILQQSGAQIQHGGNRAFYTPATDRIQLPARDQFESADKFLATAFHELSHWTGAESRLNREGITDGTAFGSERYAREELVAEIASWQIGAELQIGNEPANHGNYVASWIKVLEDDPKAILTASSLASKVQDYVLAFDPNRQIEHAAEHTIERATPYNERLASRLRALDSESRMREQQAETEQDHDVSLGH